MERPVAIAGGGREIRVLVTVLLPAPIRRVLRPCSGAGSPSPDRRHRAPRADRQDPAHPAPGRRPRRPVEAGNSTVTNRPIRRSTPPAPGRRPPTALPAPDPPDAQMLSELMPLDPIEFHHGLDRLCHGAAFPPSNARRVGPRPAVTPFDGQSPPREVKLNKWWSPFRR